MARRKSNTEIGATTEFRVGCQVFLDFAYSHPKCVNKKNQIRCPYWKCKTNNYLDRNIVNYHLLVNGFMRNYEECWWAHGQRRDGGFTVHNCGSNNNHRMNEMVHDIAGPDFDWEQSREQPMNSDAKDFFKLLDEGSEPLWDGCTKQSKLFAVATLLNIKADHNMSHECFESLLKAIKSMLPDSEKLPDNYYYCKKMVKKLGLGYQKIDAYRLKRLYMSSRTAEHMSWHAKSPAKDGELNHPADGKAWKDFDLAHPEFALETRNVRLGLSTDGFNPFGHSSVPYSCWPVIVTPYNLPPWMCMKQPYLFLSLMIPGPKSPGKNLDVYLRPLIDELKVLWKDGVQTWDGATKTNFNLKAALMWTISDFPAYGMLCGWSTHGKLACPYCMERTKSFTLPKGRKPCWFDCHRRFLPEDHPFRRNRENFRKGKVENDIPVPRLSGTDMRSCVMRLPDVPFGKNDKKIIGFGESHNWVRKSIFWELPYWSTNLIRHNLDVMHVEKNVFDNIFNTIMNTGKTKDNDATRLDMKDICKRSSLEIYESSNGKNLKPQARYTLSKKQVEEKPIWDAVTELSRFFNELCSKTLHEKVVSTLEKNIIEITCKLEKIFPPGFFDSMEHLTIHLPYEVLVGGPVQYRWMYPFERLMGMLKRAVKNRAYVEGSICEAYSFNEISTFVSDYFPDEVLTKANRVSRNDDGGNVELNGSLAIFGLPGRAYGKGKHIFLSEKDLHAAHTYILLNCEEINEYVRSYDDELKVKNPNITDKDIQINRYKEFALWMKDKALTAGSTILANVQALAMGPDKDQVIRNEKGKRVDKHGIIDIDHHKSAYSNEPFVLPTQTTQVYYTPSSGRKRDRPPADWQMLNRPTVIEVDDNEVIELDGGDDPQEIDSELILVPDDIESEEELLTDSDTESSADEDDGYESAGEDNSQSDTNT
ncbi:uncharacterized protein LOC141660653 [Apium graveolens]|uniref:uncharacterized protein LOC141660653 n=1 Tax=Apium graveolens TaxID=4045 RepID=UPI003D7A30E1